DQGLRMMSDRSGDTKMRVLALQKLSSKRRSLSGKQLMELKQMLDQQIRVTSHDPYFVAASIRTLADLLDYLKSKRTTSPADITPDGELLVQYMRDSALGLQVRGAAIRAVGDLAIASGQKSIEELLSDPAT